MESKRNYLFHRKHLGSMGEDAQILFTKLENVYVMKHETREKRTKNFLLQKLSFKIQRGKNYRFNFIRAKSIWQKKENNTEIFVTVTM